MYECQQCLNNNWTYKHIDGYVIATCLICGNEVEFLDRKGRNKRDNKQKTLIKE